MAASVKPTRLLVLAAAMLLAPAAQAEKIKNPIAVFAGLDKITGQITSFEVNIDETVQFGSLQVTPRVCYTRSASETPQTSTFMEVDDVKPDQTRHRIFTGWMFAASPGLHAVEHPVYDIWLTDCKGGKSVDPPPPPPTAEATPPSSSPAATTGGEDDLDFDTFNDDPNAPID